MTVFHQKESGPSLFPRVQLSIFFLQTPVIKDVCKHVSTVGEPKLGVASRNE